MKKQEREMIASEPLNIDNQFEPHTHTEDKVGDNANEREKSESAPNNNKPDDAC